MDKQVIYEFLLDQGDSRIRIVTLNYFKENKADIMFLAFVGDRLVGVSACRKDSEFSVTVVHRSYRGKGIGTALQSLKIAALKTEGLTYKSWIAGDNRASLKMAAKNGLKEIKEEIKTRSGGEEYIAKLFTYQ